jgi:methyl-accepting chemotaxis protein
MEAEMSEKPKFRRRNHFIKKRFQLHFSSRFLSLIIVEALLLAGLFWYMSHNTLTTSYQGAQLRIENTSSFFFPSLLYPSLIVTGVVVVIGLIGLIFISHKIAGPLYRFEKSLREIGQGDLTCRVSLRRKDQLSDLADTLNKFASEIETKVRDIKYNARETSQIMEELHSCFSSEDASDTARVEPLMKDLSARLDNIKDAVEKFETSQVVKENDSKIREA